MHLDKNVILCYNIGGLKTLRGYHLHRYGGGCFSHGEVAFLFLELAFPDIWGEVVHMVTWIELFAFCALLVQLLAIFLSINQNNQKKK